MEVAKDVIGGRNIKEMLKDRGLAGIKKRSPRSKISRRLTSNNHRRRRKKETASVADKNQTTVPMSAERRSCMRQKQ